MIKIDYKIERDEGNETIVYKPDKLPKEYGIVSYIKAPNSTGKSTLLNLLALGFYGNKLTDSELENSLKRKIDNLLDIEHQKVVFDISVDNPLIGWKLKTSKPNPNSTDISVVLYQDGQKKQLSSETFFKHFRLIYDIPSNPLERLPQLLQEVKSSQIEIGQKINQFRERLRVLISEVRNSRDPEILKEYNDNLNILLTEKEKIDRQTRLLKIQAYKILEYYLSRFYLEAVRDITAHKKRLEELEEELDEAKKDGRTSARKLTKLNNEIADQKEDTIKLYNNLNILLSQTIPNEERAHFELWKETNISNEVYQSDLYINIREKNKHFINMFSQALKNERKIFSDDLEKIDFYRKLLSTLADIRYQNIKLPGIDQTVNSFKQLINNELENHKDLEERLENLEKIISRIKEFDRSLKKTITLVKQFAEFNIEVSSTSSGRDIQAISDDIWATKDIIKKLEEKASQFRKNLIGNHFDPTKSHIRFEALQKDEDLQQFIYLSEGKIYEKVSKANSNLISTQAKSKRYEEMIQSQKDEIEKMELKEPHEYRKYLNILDRLFLISTRLEQRFVSHYSKWINNIIDGKRLSDNEILFTTYLGEFLSTKISTVKHIENNYKVTNIDLLKRKIITEENKEIKFDDIGTGQSQAAFLQGKLAMNDERKIIAMIDEVAMMDENTLEPIKNRLSSLYKEKKLFMAIIAQKSEEVIIEDLT